MSKFVATRAAGLAAMQACIDGMGRQYEQGRNYDNGPRRHTHVSMLSPYISVA
ncbi:MAG: hypothetical protein ABJM43_00120 [Paracoccaceae bacterium]